MGSDVICIIPARGGSKGVPHKNLKMIGGIPLVVRTIKQAVFSGKISKVYVSTDDEKISHISKLAGAEVLHRPTNLAGDTVTSEAVLLHVLTYQILTEKDTICIFAQCTSPFTQTKDFNALIDEMDKNDSVAFFKKDHGNFLGIDDLKVIRQPRQASEEHHRELGNAWAFRCGGFKKEMTRLHGRIGWVELGFPKDIEIDTQDELKLCDLIQKNWKL